MFLLAGLMGMLMIGASTILIADEIDPDDDMDSGAADEPPPEDTGNLLDDIDLSPDDPGADSRSGASSAAPSADTAPMDRLLTEEDDLDAVTSALLSLTSGAPLGVIDPGTAGDDALTGTELDDQLHGGDGADAVAGSGGDDWALGGDDGDLLQGGSGDDTLEGGDGDDTIRGDDGADRMFGMMGQDMLHGGAGNDSLDGGAREDRLDGGSGDDALHGGLHDDHLTGGEGNDTLFGGGGADWLDGTSVSTGPGPGQDATAADTSGADHLNGGAGDDTISAGAGDIVTGGAGFDTILTALGPGDGPEILDFDSLDDQLVLLYSGPVAPVIDLVEDIGAGVTRIFADGELAATIRGLEVDPAALALIPETAAAEAGFAA